MPNMSVCGLLNPIIMLANAEVRLALSVSYEDRKAAEKPVEELLTIGILRKSAVL